MSEYQERLNKAIEQEKEQKKVAHVHKNIQWFDAHNTSYGIETKTFVDLGEVIRRVEQLILDSELRNDNNHILLVGIEVRKELGSPYSDLNKIEVKQVIEYGKDEYEEKEMRHI